MSKAAVAICSFAIGICFALVLDRREPVAEALSQPKTVILTPQGSVPTFSPLAGYVNQNITFAGLPQMLDGLDCESCTFQDAELTYGGGAFNLPNIRIAGTTHLVLTGAAANTAALLDFLKGISIGSAGTLPPPKKTVEKKATAKKPLTLNWSSPNIGGS